MSEDPIDKMAPWTIKSVSTVTRDTVTNAARRDGLTVGQWLERRVAEWEGAGSPVQVGGSQATSVAPATMLDMHALEAAARAMAALSQAPDTPAARRTVTSIAGAIGDQVREARRAKGGKTKFPTEDDPKQRLAIAGEELAAAKEEMEQADGKTRSQTGDDQFRQVTVKLAPLFGGRSVTVNEKTETVELAAISYPPGKGADPRIPKRKTKS